MKISEGKEGQIIIKILERAIGSHYFMFITIRCVCVCVCDIAIAVAPVYLPKIESKTYC